MVVSWVDALRRQVDLSVPDDAGVPSEFLDATDASSELVDQGRRLIAAGKVGVLMLAGGASTRMSADRLRGDLEVGPVTNRSIFRLQLEKVVALRRRYNVPLTLLVMTSPMVYQQTLEVFRRENYYGMPVEDVWFFQQSELPLLDPDLKPECDAPRMFPTGHGGLLEALESARLLPRIRAAGIEHLFCFQYPNVLEQICDPGALGYHLCNEFDVTTKGFREGGTDEKLGRLVTVGGRLTVVEYHALADHPIPSWWSLAPVSMAAHIWKVDFLERCVAGKVRLPFYLTPLRSAKEDGTRWKLEQFVFDLFTYAAGSGLVLVRRDREYAAVKTPDSLLAARDALSREYVRWMDMAGAIAGKQHCQVEISPLFALDAEQLRERLGAGFHYDDNLVLC